MPITLPPAPDAPESPEGLYASWQGFIEALGQTNAQNGSNLDSEDVNPNDTLAADFARIEATIAQADAYATFRATRGSKPVATPIGPDDAIYLLVQKAADLYGAFQLIRRRVWFAGEGDAGRNTIMLSLEGQYEKAFTELFGAVETNDPAKPKPGTFQNVKMAFEPTCICDEFSS